MRLGSDAKLLPLGVRWFYLQALGTALRAEDRWTLAHAHSSSELAGLLGVADGSEQVVQLGAQTGWAAIALALSTERRQVTAFGRHEGARWPEAYTSLVDTSVRDRIDFREEPVDGVARLLSASADLVLVDPPPDNDEETFAALVTGEQVVRPGGTVVVRGHLRPELRAAIKKLQLEGSVADSVSLWRMPLEAERPALSVEVVRPRLRLLGFALAGSLIGAAAGLTEPFEEPINDALQGRGDRGEPRLSPATPGAGRRETRSSSLAGSRPRRPRDTARPPRRPEIGNFRTFSGASNRKLGTIQVDRPTVLRWKAKSGSFLIESDDWRLRARARRGRTVLSPGTYRSFGVRTTGSWELTFRRAR